MRNFFGKIFIYLIMTPFHLIEGIFNYFFEYCHDALSYTLIRINPAIQITIKTTKEERNIEND